MQFVSEGSELVPQEYDRQKVIYYTLTSDDLYRYSAQDILMSWLMDLDASVDPRCAAASLLEYYTQCPDVIDGAQQQAVLELLRQTSTSITKNNRRGQVSKRKRAGARAPRENR